MMPDGWQRHVAALHGGPAVAERLAAAVQVEYALESLERAMKWDEEVFGLEYDLDLFNIVAVDDFNMVRTGGMGLTGLAVGGMLCGIMGGI